MTKPISMIQDEIISAIKAFSVKGKYRIVGSNATRGVLYGSDYDSNSEIGSTDLMTHLQNLFKNPKDITPIP